MHMTAFSAPYILLPVFILFPVLSLLTTLSFHRKSAAMKKKQALLQSRIHELTDGVSAKNKFLASVSHELKTPLNTILGITYLLLRTPLSESQKDLLSKLESASDLLLGIIEDVLDFSKLDTPTFRIHPHPVSVTQLVVDTERLFMEQIRAKGLSWRCHCSVPPEIMLNLDKYRVSQVLMNLINNAIKFTERGFISLDVETNFSTRNHVDLTLRVKDSGIGIPSEKIPAIFEAFEQIENPLTKNHQGTGLGLPITKKIVEAMGGSIRVESSPHKGCRFTVLIPQIPLITESSHSTWKTVSRTAPESIRPVLIVDDTAINAEIAQQLLLEIGISSDTACDGTEAIRLCRHRDPSHYSLILMDIHMPKMNGYDAAEILKNDVRVTCPILALTATSPDEAQQDPTASCIDGMIQKPFRAASFQKEIIQRLSLSEIILPPSDPPESENAVSEKKPTTPQRASGAADLSTEPLYNPEEGLGHFGGRQDLLEKYIQRFCGEYADADRTIQALLDKGDLQEAHRVTHSLKGIAGMLGLRRLFSVSAELDRTIKEGNSRELPSCFHRFSSILKASISSMSFSDRQSG